MWLSVARLGALQKTLAENLKNPIFPDFALNMRAEIARWRDEPFLNGSQSKPASLKDVIMAGLSPSPEIGIDSRLKIVSVQELSSYISTNKIPKNIALLHSLASIEYSAVLGYSSILLMPSLLLQGSSDAEPQVGQSSESTYESFCSDILSVVDDECWHFACLESLLHKLGHPFGSLPVNSNIRDDLAKTEGNQLHRLVLVSLLHEGRGLDAGPRVLHKLGIGEQRDLLALILQEEVRHVHIGLRWVQHLVGGEIHVPKLIHEVSQRTGVKNSPERMNFEMRAQAGFRKEWAYYSPD
jgi:uncharacterized ferritin-like protein (DUF455 family)